MVRLRQPHVQAILPRTPSGLLDPGHPDSRDLIHPRRLQLRGDDHQHARSGYAPPLDAGLRVDGAGDAGPHAAGLPSLDDRNDLRRVMGTITLFGGEAVGSPASSCGSARGRPRWGCLYLVTIEGRRTPDTSASSI